MVCCRSLFNFALPDLPRMIVLDPECPFWLNAGLNYSQKWLLEMASPLIVAMLLLLLIGLRYALWAHTLALQHPPVLSEPGVLCVPQLRVVVAGA
jgi:hypothetical protein